MSQTPLIIVSGPSGSGKSTLIRRVMSQKRRPLRLAVSATTREQRPHEEEGVDYFFLPDQVFQDKLKDNAFLEHAVVHGQYYGTPRSEVDEWRKKGYGVVLDIDVQGFMQVRRLYDDYVSIFVKLPSWEMYRERLTLRGTETPRNLERRLETARRELDLADQYQHTIINDDLETAVRQLGELFDRAFST